MSDLPASAKPSPVRRHGRAGSEKRRARPAPVAREDAGEPVARDELRLFEKCRQYTIVKEAQAAGVYPYFRPISKSEDTVVTMEGKRRIMLGSNNYLGLTHHPKVLEAASDALRRFGAGCTGSRFLNGTLDLHNQLEHAIAEFVGKEDCLVFSTGYQANLGLVSGLVSRGDIVYLDKLDHASIIDGAKMSYGETARFRHCDLDDLERLFRSRNGDGGSLIVVDGVFSMEGSIADIPGLVQIAKKHGAVLAIDDAHAIGVLGPNGQGTTAHFGLTDEVEIITGTFSKSLASIGGFVAASENVIHYLKHHSRPLMFTASLPPASTAGVLAALQVIREEPERAQQLWLNTRRLQDGLRGLGFDIGPTETPIVPVLVGALGQMLEFWRKLYDAGVFTNPIPPPAVSPDACRLRTSVMATHTSEHIDYCLDVFKRVGRELGII